MLNVAQIADIFNHMVEQSSQRLDRMFQAMAQPTRRALLRELSKRERTVGQLAEPFDLTVAAISKHIKVLEAAGLVTQRAEGRTRVCRLNPQPLSEMTRVLAEYERFWQGAIDSLDQMLRKKKKRGSSSR